MGGQALKRTLRAGGLGFPTQKEILLCILGSSVEVELTADQTYLQKTFCHCSFSLKVTFLTGQQCEQDGVVLIRISNVLGEKKNHCVWHTLALSGLCSLLPIYFSCFPFFFLRPFNVITAFNSLPSEFPQTKHLCVNCQLFIFDFAFLDKYEGSSLNFFQFSSLF